MRHRVYGKKLGRNKNERSALFKSLLQELFLHGSITTTEGKAKAIKGLVDKIINLAKNKNSQRLLQFYFANKALRDRLIKEISPKLAGRVSGYTSQIRIGVRAGDNTRLVKMILIGAEELKPMEKVSGGPRRGRQQATDKKVTPRKPVARKSVAKTK